MFRSQNQKSILFRKIALNQWMSIDLVIGVYFYINVIDLQSPIALRSLNKKDDFSSSFV